MSSEPRALLDLWRRKLAQGAGTIDLGGCGVEGTMVYWTDVLYERPDPDLAAFERGAGVGVAKSPEGHHGIRFRKSDSHRTRRWREPDSNPWSPLNRRRLGDHPWRLVRMRVRPKRPTSSQGGDRRFESAFLQRRVRVSRDFALSRREAGFSRGCAGPAGAARSAETCRAKFQYRGVDEH